MQSRIAEDWEQFIAEDWEADLDSYELEEKARQERNDRLWSNFEEAKENPEFNIWLEEQKENIEAGFSFPEEMDEEDYFYESTVNGRASDLLNVYGCYVANSGALPQNPYEDYQRFNAFALQSEQRGADFEEYLCEWEDHAALKKISEVKKADAEHYLQMNLNFSRGLGAYENQLDRQKKPKEWARFDEAKMNNPRFVTWIEKQKEDVARWEDILSRADLKRFQAVASGKDHGKSFTEAEEGLISRKVEAYAFYVHSACGGNLGLNPYAEHKRFEEFRNNPDYNTERSLEDRKMLNEMAGAIKFQARAYVREKFGCGLEEYEKQREQKQMSKEKTKDASLEF